MISINYNFSIILLGAFTFIAVVLIASIYLRKKARSNSQKHKNSAPEPTPVVGYVELSPSEKIRVDRECRAKGTDGSVQSIIQQITDWGIYPLAFQAMWELDSYYCWVDLSVIDQVDGMYIATRVCFKCDSKSKGMPSWEEYAAAAAQFGEALARHYGVPFHFPSPDDYEFDCPNWWEQDKAISCEGCSRLVLPLENQSWPKELCYRCRDKRVKKEKIRKDPPENPDRR